jgi:ketosteroid isomerase-like protein
MNLDKSISSSESEIKNSIEKRVQAIRTNDIATAVLNYADDVLLFDVVGQLSETGSSAVKKRLEDWFSTLESPIGFEIDQLSISTGNDIAFCSSFNHVMATKKDGGKLDMWWRETLGWKKINDRWMVTHAHSSVPFNGQDGMASTNLKP